MKREKKSRMKREKKSRMKREKKSRMKREKKSRMKREKKSRGAVRRGDPSEPLSDKKKLVMVFETEIKNQTAPLVDDSTDDEFAGLPPMKAAALEPYMTIYGNTPYVVMYTIYVY